MSLSKIKRRKEWFAAQAKKAKPTQEDVVLTTVENKKQAVKPKKNSLVEVNTDE